MRIRAVVLREPGRPVAVEEIELDPPKAKEVLVRVAAAGVCHSDVRIADTSSPATMSSSRSFLAAASAGPAAPDARTSASGLVQTAFEAS
jgi:S-(hydroxymethyl)glutathione dehydrogenase/alcohol dehydrogenase